MNAWAARRFWTTARVLAADDGFAVHLDDRPVRTPAKALLILPTEGLAQAIADEWQGVEGKVNPAVMPFTRMANSAIDKVAPQFDAVVAMLAAYGGSDLICYRADGPEVLVLRQGGGWDPLLAWVSAALNAPLQVTSGIMHRAQPEASLQTLHRTVHGLTPFQVTAFHDLVAISGSLVLALAVARGRLTAESAWTLSRIDEDWQIEEWGEDEEAAEMAAGKHADFLQADRFYALCG